LPSATNRTLGKEVIKKISLTNARALNKDFIKKIISLPSARNRALGKEFIKKNSLPSARWWTLGKDRQPSPTTIFAKCRALPSIRLSV
jgi:hypothetical protein